MAQQVFFDPRQARWKRVRRFFDILGVSITGLILFFVYTALRSEPLPELLLPAMKRPFHSLKETEKEKAKEKRRQAARRGHRKTKGAPSQVKLNAEEGIRAAFYVPYDAASFSSLREYARQIDLLFPDWLHVVTPDGHLQGTDLETNNFFDVVQGPAVHAVDDKVMSFLKLEDTGLEVFPMVNNFDGTNWMSGIGAFLNDPEARARFRQQVAAFLASDKYRGLMVDFEDFPKSAQNGYLVLLGELSTDLHAKGMKLYVSVQARNEDFDYPAIAARIDGAVIMNYDEHYPGGKPGPVASQDWFVANLEAVKKVVPHEKIICAIGNYGYDWARKPKHGTLPSDVKDTNVSVQDAWLSARDSDADVDFDGDSLNPHVSYFDERNLPHDIWFLDAVTALNQMRAAQSLGINTFAL